MITSTSNSHIKEIRKLKDKKYRNESGVYLIEGTRIVIEAIEESKKIEEIIVAREMLKTNAAEKAVIEAEKKGIQILEVSADVFNSLSIKDNPQGIAALLSQDDKKIIDIEQDFCGIWIALYQIADPGNLGTIIRTLDGMGGKGIILINNCTDPYDPTTIRASMGSFFSKPIIKTDIDEFSEWIEKKRITIIGTSDAAKQKYTEFDFPQNMVLLMGSEREGIPEKLAEQCEEIVSIPMTGKADSLNLAVASSILLYEIFNQHSKPSLGGKS